MAKGENPYPLLWQLFLSKVPVPMRNRYWLTGIAFALWITCCDKANPWTHFRLQRSLNKLEKEKIFYDNKMKMLLMRKSNIDSNTENFAREQYFMRASDEEVFIIDEVNKEKN